MQYLLYTHTPFSLVAACCFILSGCHSTPRAAPSTQPLLSTALPDIPVVYAGYLDPAPLTPALKLHVLQLAAEDRPKDRDIWFMLVLSNFDHYYSVEVFYTPSQFTPRILRGKSTFITDQTEQIRLIRTRLWPDRTDYLGDYVQISSAGLPFSGKLGTGWQGDFPSLLPFSPPDFLTDNELVQAVDCARSALRGNTQPDYTQAVSSADASLPIARIEKGSTGSELITIYFGWQVGPLAGRGRYVTVKRTAHGFEAVDGIGMWLS